MSQQSTAQAPGLGAIRDVVLQAALAAGEILRTNLGKVQHLRYKGEVDVVTEVDEQSECAVVEIIRQHFPDHTILAEEGSVGGQDTRYRWIVDPLDGTTNYAHGVPVFCVSIAFEQDGQVEVGAIFDPLRDEMFLAQRGHGATLNGRRLAVTTTDVLIHSLLATGFPYDRTLLPAALAQFAALSGRSQAVRRIGSAALDCAYVAAGRFDGYWESVVFPWDVAAGWLLVAEAGGQVTNLQGGPFRFADRAIVVTNGRIHQALLTALAEASRSRRDSGRGDR